MCHYFPQIFDEGFDFVIYLRGSSWFDGLTTNGRGLTTNGGEEFMVRRAHHEREGAHHEREGADHERRGV
jgi:hypothetical protein